VSRFRFKLVPRDERFFDLFVQLATTVREAALAYQGLVDDFTDIAEKAGRLRDIEHEGDEITHETMRRLNTVFITPFDHDDIYRLTSRLDDVVDHIEAAGDQMVLHKIERPLPEMKAQADVLVQAANVTLEAMRILPRYDRLESSWHEINRLENEGDRIYRRAIADLFGGDHRAMDVLKWKAIIDEAEVALDTLEDVANLLEAIALKQT
jgi:predicted phosphate transport protein (TIGR00153 family)